MFEICSDACLLLDWKIAGNYQKRARQTREYPLDYGEMRILKCELMELCGITELEAHNVLIGYNVRDYIAIYTGREDSLAVQKAELYENSRNAIIIQEEIGL